MTDQIPADKVRTILDEWERIKEHADWDDIDNLVQDVRALLPTPPRPTLADMTRDEQDECAGMQADLAQGDRVVILDGTPDAAGLVQVLEKSLDVYRAYPKEVTPRPDLPRMEWPGDTPTGSDHLAVGTVIESADDPRLAALPVGSILVDRDGGPFDIAKTDTGEWAGPGYVPVQDTGTKWGPWTVRRIGKGADQ